MATKIIIYKDETYTAKYFLDPLEHVLHIDILNIFSDVIWHEDYDIGSFESPYEIHLSSLILSTFNNYLANLAWLDHQEEDLKGWNGIAIDPSEYSLGMEITLCEGKLTGTQINEFTKEVMESNGSNNEDTNNK